MDWLFTGNFSTIVITLLQLVTAVLALGLLLLFVGLGIEKDRQNTLAVRDGRLCARYLQQLQRAVDGHGMRITPAASFGDLISLSKTYAAFFEQGRHVPALLPAAIAQPEHLKLIEKALRSRQWGVRYRAVDVIVNLRMHATIEQIKELARRENNIYVYSHCLRAWALSIENAVDFDQLIDLMNQRASLSTNLIEGISRIAIQSLAAVTSAAAFTDILSVHLLSANIGYAFKIGLINAIGREEVTALKEQLIRLARRENSMSLDLSVMRAIANMGQHDAWIVGHIESPDPVIQVVAIRSSVHGDAVSLQAIGRQLGSDSFDVRFAAATTLIKMGEQGRRLLFAALSGPDRYAKNMAMFALSLG